MANAPMPSSALDRLLALLPKDPTNRLLRRDAVSQAIKEGQWETAVELAQAGLALRPDDHELLVMMGMALLHDARYAEAQSAFESAVSRGERALAVVYNIAFAQFMQARYGEALARLSSPDLVEEVAAAHLLRARCLEYLSQPDDAVGECEAFLQRVPGDIEGRGFLAWLLARGDRREQAKVLAEGVLGEEPAQLDAMLAMAALHSASGDHAAAIAWYERLVAHHPQCGRGWLALALERALEQDLAGAREAATEAAKYQPEHVGTWHVLGWLSLLAEDLTAAQRAFDRALSVDRNFGETHGALAAVAALRGEEAEAQNGIRRALGLNPNASSIYYARYALALKAGDYGAARQQLEAYLQLSGQGQDARMQAMLMTRLSTAATGTSRRPDGRTLH
jgi:tetratricopeptide (TPR) repeat protein